MHNVAPVALFVYNRLRHTRQTVEALKANNLANKSELFIYSDAAQNEQNVETVAAVRDYISQIDGFKSITLIRRESNWGLAANIIDGVTDIINKYGKIIVLEDDLVSSPHYLTFVNGALEFYKNEPKLWHISGYNCPICPDGLEDTFVWRMMYCWGWGTWADRWKHYRKNTDELINNFTREDIDRFNLDGEANVWNHVLGNQRGEINTWAIYWYATIFNQRGLCLNPTISYIKNIGRDGSGVHHENIWRSDEQRINDRPDARFTNDLQESPIVLDRIKMYYRSQKKPRHIRAINRILRFFLGRSLIR